MCDFLAKFSVKSGFEFFKGKESVFDVLESVFDAVCEGVERSVRESVEKGGIIETKTYFSIFGDFNILAGFM